MAKNDIYFVLGSTSPTRLTMLQQIGFNPNEILSTNINETILKEERPKQMSYRLAQEKNFAANEAIKLNTSHWDRELFFKCIVVTCDTVVGKGARMIDKAITDQDVADSMATLSGGQHQVHSTICASIINQDGTIEKTVTKISTTKIKFKKLSALDIQHAVESKNGLNKAGGYSIVGMASAFIFHTTGCTSTVMGFNAHHMRNILLSFGLTPSFNI